MVVVRKFFEYLEATFGYQNVAKGIKGGKRAKGFRKEPLTVEQIKELLDRINRATIQGVRDYAMLNLMLRTGLRTIEVIRADVGDIRQQSGEAVLWIHGKGRDIHLDSDRLTAHSLRHSFATIALLNGAPLLQVKEAMRHNSIEATMIYAHAMDRVSNGAERYVRF